MNTIDRNLAYSIDEHRHRFAAWAASRAASVNGCRFTVVKGKAVLEAAGMNVLLENIESLPTPDKVDEEHREWRKLVMQAATAQELPFTHGVAAKLINVYLKAGFVCGGHHESQRVQSLHPPIDAVLLNELAELDVGGFRKDWKQAMKIRWSNFNSEQYEAVIQKLRVALDGEPLWMAEQYWQGYQ